MTYLLFFIKILYQIYLNKHLLQILQISAFVFWTNQATRYTVLVPGIICVVFLLVNQNK
jgi:hypothetical protein